MYILIAHTQSAVYYLGKDQYVYHGAKVTMIVYGAPNIQRDQLSTSAIWLTNWVPGGELNELVLGWHVSFNYFPLILFSLNYSF